jgi:hypothetical protein
MYQVRRNVTELVFLVFAVAFVVLALIGAVRAYSPVPLWDMWNGYLGFYVKASSGEWSAWWAQHNEHRVVLARLFFWMDLAFFRGTGWFLILVNYLLLVLVCVVFLLGWREQSGGKVGLVGLFLIAWLFSWLQSENLTWGFQSQFILAQLLPLAAFYLLHKSQVTERHSVPYFAAAVLSGVLAIGSMANGVLTLPLMTLFCVLVRCGWRRCCVLAVLSIISLWIYFYGYIAPGGHGSLGRALREDPSGLIQYVLAYVGGPFYFLARGGAIGLMLVKVAGGLLILSSAVFFWQSLKNPKRSTLQLAMLFFILYIGGTALGTAGGRLIFGVEQALSSRYMTPSLMAWAALAVLSAPFILARARWGLGPMLLTLLVAMVPHQLKALESKRGVLFERNVAALAIELGVKDQAQISNVYPHADGALSTAKIPVESNLSIFGLPPLVDLRERIGQRYERGNYPVRECLGQLNEIQLVPEDQRFFRIRGWVFDPLTQKQPEAISVLDVDGRLVGFAISGQPRPDIALAIGEGAQESGFKGYLLSEIQGVPFFAVGDGAQCRLSSDIPIQLFKVIKSGASPLAPSVSTASILEGNEWVGKDFAKSSLPGMTVIGSFINSDADVGSLTLRMKRGDRVLYRSGPTTERQVIEILDSGLAPAQLPVAPEWTLLEFSNDKLPIEFLVRFSDHGDGWGEWSAVALNE